MRTSLMIAAAFALSGCAPLILASDGNSVTVRTNAEPIYPAGDVADDYCRDKGMHAEFQRLDALEGAATYDCAPGVWPRPGFDPRL